MLPRTYLLTAPADLAATNAHGSAMRHVDLVEKLQECNPAIRCPMHEYEATTLWLGAPYAPGSRFLLAIPQGMIPEFTLLDAQGIPTKRGWRAVVEKLWRAKIITKRRVEKAFGISFDADGWDGYCIECRRATVLKKAVSSISKRCQWHEDIWTEANKEPDRERARWRPSGKVMVDYGNTRVQGTPQVRNPAGQQGTDLLLAYAGVGLRK